MSSPVLSSQLQAELHSDVGEVLIESSVILNDLLGHDKLSGQRNFEIESGMLLELVVADGKNKRDQPQKGQIKEYKESVRELTCFDQER